MTLFSIAHHHCKQNAQLHRGDLGTIGSEVYFCCMSSRNKPLNITWVAHTNKQSNIREYLWVEPEEAAAEVGAGEREGYTAWSFVTPPTQLSNLFTSTGGTTRAHWLTERECMVHWRLQPPGTIALPNSITLKHCIGISKDWSPIARENTQTCFFFNKKIFVEKNILKQKTFYCYFSKNLYFCH